MSLIERLKCESLLFWCFTFLAIASPLASLFLPWRPEGETKAVWFQRSGAMTIVFALVAEAGALRFQKALFPSSSFSNPEAQKARAIYWRRPAIMNVSAFFVIAIGTFIWGYGDLIIKME